MSEWTPLASGFASKVRKYSEPPEFAYEVDAVHLISQDNNGTSEGSYGKVTALPNTSTTIHVYDDPAVFNQARPMAIGMPLPISTAFGMGYYGTYTQVPVVGELTIKVCNTPARNSGVYAKLKRRIITAFPTETTEEGYFTVYESARSGGGWSGLPANLPLVEFWPFLDSARATFMFGAGYAMYVTQAIELEYGIIGSSPIGTVSYELEAQKTGYTEPLLEVGVYNPCGSDSAVGFVGDPEQPFRFSASFSVPLNFKASGDINPRSYASLTISSGPTTWTSPTITPYRGDSFSATVNASPVWLDTARIYRRSVEFDHGRAVRGNGSKWCRRIGTAYGYLTSKGAGNHAPKTRMVAVDATITDQHRKQFTEGAFGFPLTQSQNLWATVASNYTRGAKITPTNAPLSAQTTGVLIWGKEFELYGANHHGVEFAPNNAYGFKSDLDETVLVTPSDEKLYEKPPAAIINPPGVSGRKVLIMAAINVSEVGSFIDGINQAIDNCEEYFKWYGTGYSYGGSGTLHNVPIIAFEKRQYTITRLKAQSYLSLALTNKYKSVEVPFSGTENDATIATSGGVAANRQGTQVMFDVFDGKLSARFSANVVGKKNLTKKVRWSPANFITSDPYDFSNRKVVTIYYTDTRMVEVADLDEPFSCFRQSFDANATLTDAELQQLTTTGTTTIGFSVASGNTNFFNMFNEEPISQSANFGPLTDYETKLQITLT
jgi:hypothetical protein